MGGAGAYRLYRHFMADRSLVLPTLSYALDPRFSRPGWLFLFSVLMAAGLLFTMVFFVRYAIVPRYGPSFSYYTDYHVLGFGVRLHQPYRSL
jgi:hypothetical protein